MYLLPGLGFDQRIFSKLTLEGPVSYLNWIESEVGETWTSYAQRMAASISPVDVPPILIGHSLGGMLALEIASFMEVEQVILLSSIRSRAELPFHFRVVKPLGVHRIFSKGLTLSTFSLWAKSHGYKDQESQTLFQSMVGQQSNTYLRWALRQLSIWEHPVISAQTKVCQIIGDQDKTFPIQKKATPDVVIPGGSHFMLYNQPGLISKAINQLLDSN